MEIVKTNVIAAGQRSVNDKISFEFQLQDDIDGEKIIDYIWPDCVICTKVRLEGNKIKGTIDIEKVQPYIASRTVVNKIIFVALNDGEDFFKGKEKSKNRITNPRKKVLKLNITFVVIK